MTRSAKLVSRLSHHQSAPSVLHRRTNIYLNNAHTARLNSSSFSNFASRQEAVRLQESRRVDTSRLCFSNPLRAGARPFTSQTRIKQLVSRPADSPASQPPLSSKASFNSWAAVIIIGILSGTIFYNISPSAPRSHNSPPLPESHTSDLPIYTEAPNTMAKDALPGRPGTLTPHEEEKLREFWVATLQVFGLDPTPPNGHHEAPSIARSETGEKPKKKRFGLLRSSNSKKPKDDSDHSTTSSSGGAEDDKYGQTKEFHDALATLTPATLRATFWSMVKHDHPDALLLRFLRARKWDVEKALVMMVSTMRWRATDMKVDSDIMLRGELGMLDDVDSEDAAKRKQGADFLAQMRLGKSFLHGLDRDGRPMCFVRVRLHRQGEQSEESLERYTVFVIESARMILSPPVDTACVVFDMTGFSMANMDYAPVKFMIKCFEANYPESLGVVLIHKAPWIFQGIYKIIRGWLDPVVASKVHFTNNATEMAAFVPESHIVTELAGDEQWRYEYIEPVRGENEKMKDVATRERLEGERQLMVEEFEEKTLAWVGGDQGVKGERSEIANRLRDGYWVLDPYVRARSYYDRVGLINPGGKLRFYPDEKGAETLVPEEKVVDATPQEKVADATPNEKVVDAPPAAAAPVPIETSAADLD